MRIASAPGGTGAPVKMRTASPGADGAVVVAAGGGHADHLQGGGRPGGVGGAHGIAVHGGGVEGRLAAPRLERLAKRAPAGLGERHVIARHRGGADDDAGDGLVDGKERRHLRFSLGRFSLVFHVPDLPPRFSIRRMPVMAMPRSTALAMS